MGVTPIPQPGKDAKNKKKKSTGQYPPMNGVSKILNKITSKPFQYVERPVHAG